jgi:hypothetical protein
MLKHHFSALLTFPIAETPLSATPHLFPTTVQHFGLSPLLKHHYQQPHTFFPITVQQPFTTFPAAETPFFSTF